MTRFFIQKRYNSITVIEKDQFKRKKPYPLNVEIKIHRVKGPEKIQAFRTFHFHSVFEEKELLQLINDTSWNWSPDEK